MCSIYSVLAIKCVCVCVGGGCERERAPGARGGGCLGLYAMKEITCAEIQVFSNTCVAFFPAFCCCSLGGESEQYSMYPSNRVKRRPAPYEVELDEGRRILDLYKYGKTLCPSANTVPKMSPPHLHCHSSTDMDLYCNQSFAEDVLQKENSAQGFKPRKYIIIHGINECC